jgi:hypothetical protein
MAETSGGLALITHARHIHWQAIIFIISGAKRSVAAVRMQISLYHSLKGLFYSKGFSSDAQRRFGPRN